MNDSGPEPVEYLEFAKRDLEATGVHGAINALTNAKRAVQLTLTRFLGIVGLTNAYAKANFPTQMGVIRDINAFPTRMLESLNQKRNFVEHEYETVDPNIAADFVDIAEMFLLLAYPYLREMIIGAYVGLEGSEDCLVWTLHPGRCEIQVFHVPDCYILQTEIGGVRYPRSGDKDTWSLKQTIAITRSNSKEWLPYLDFFMYWTKRAKTLPPKEIGSKYGMFQEVIHFEILGEDLVASRAAVQK